MIHVGIDPGKNTGLAIVENGELTRCDTYRIHEALRIIGLLHEDEDEPITLYVENPNTWVPFKGHSRENAAKIQGAGSVKRDYAIWKDFCEDLKIPMVSIKLQGGMKKMNPELFKRMTGWKERTSEHARDAACLIWGRK